VEEGRRRLQWGLTGIDTSLQLNAIQQFSGHMKSRTNLKTPQKPHQKPFSIPHHKV
jgi:hypothetical protein